MWINRFGFCSFQSTRKFLPRGRTVLFMGGMVFALGLGLRLMRIAWGYPYFLHPDESQMFDVVFAMMRNADPNPHHFYYGNGLFYLMQLWLAPLIGYANAREWIPSVPAVNFYAMGIATNDLPLSILYGRLLTITMGALIPVVIFDATRRTSSLFAATVAGLFLAFSPLLVRESGWVLTNSPMALLLAFGIWLAVRFYITGNWKWLRYSGLAMGMSASFKYTGGLGTLIPFSMLVLDARISPKILRLFELAGWLIFGFLVLTPFAFFDPYHFMRGVGGQFLLRSGNRGGSGHDTFGFFADLLFREESVLFAFLLLLSVALILTQRKRIYYSFLPPLFGYLAIIFSARLGYDRDLMPLLVLGSFVCASALEWIQRKNLYLAGIVGLLLVGQPLFMTIQMNLNGLKIARQISTANLLAQIARRSAQVLVIGGYSMVPPPRSDIYSVFVENLAEIGSINPNSFDYVVLAPGTYEARDCALPANSFESRYRLLADVEGNLICEK